MAFLYPFPHHFLRVMQTLALLEHTLFRGHARVASDAYGPREIGVKIL
jgi:hypothetical protein